MTGHDRSGAASICDALYRSLRKRLPTLQRREVKNWCGLLERDASRFAYIKHHKSDLEIWFIGGSVDISKYPALHIRVRRAGSHGFERFTHRFNLTAAEIEPAGRLLSEIAISRRSIQREVRAGVYPDELRQTQSLREGAATQVVVNGHERNRAAREICIQHYGTSCAVCSFDFGARYGPDGEGIIHVHHLRSLAESQGEHDINPVRDLRPVCPNCHTMIHSQEPPLSIDQMKMLIRQFGDPHRPKSSGSIESD